MRKALVTLLAVGLSLLATAAAAGTHRPGPAGAAGQAAGRPARQRHRPLHRTGPHRGHQPGPHRPQGHAQAAARGNRPARSRTPPAARTPWPPTCSPPRPAASVVGFTRYWIANLMVVQAVPAEIERIAARSDVAYVEPNFVPELIEPVDVPPACTGDGRRPTPAASASRPASWPSAPAEVWDELGIDGAGALIGSLDTGVDGNHPGPARRAGAAPIAPVERVLARRARHRTPSSPTTATATAPTPWAP